MKLFKKIIYYIFITIVILPIALFGIIGAIIDFIHENLNLTDFVNYLIDKCIIIKMKLLQ